MGLKITIEEAARRALKNQEPLLVSTLRLLLSAIHNQEIEKKAKTGQSELSEEEVTGVLRSEAKKCRDAASEFQKGGRADLAEKESRELSILEKYLPAELSDEEIEKLAAPLAKGASASDFGRVMGAAMKEIAGRASGERVAAVVKKVLQG